MNQTSAAIKKVPVFLNIPKRINRSPTDLLKELSKTVDIVNDLFYFSS
jgi:hypothetical protein